MNLWTSPFPRMAFLRDDLAQLAAYKSPHPIADDTPAGNSSHQGSVQPVLDPLDTNESPTDLPDKIKADLAEAYQSTIEANRYPDGTCLPLKQAVMRYAAGSSKISPKTITVENITLGNGSDELIRSVIMATCLGGHGSILVADPTFSMYAILAKTLGVKVHHVNRDDSFAVDLAAAQSAIDSAQSDGLPVRTIFMVHPNSPTGNALTAAEQNWLKQLPENILVVVDEAYFEFSGHTMLAEALSRPNWLVTRTFSKAFRLAAHRVGYGIGHPAIIAALEKLRLPYNLPSFSQTAAMAALAYSDALLAQIPTIVAERNRLLDVLSQHPYLRVWPSDSNFVYAQLSDRGLAAVESTQSEEGLRKVFVALREKGTLIRHTGGGLRISIGTASGNNRTLANLQQVLGSKP